MSDVLRRPSLIAIEIAWRWLFGIPFLFVCWKQTQRILMAFPPESSVWSSIDAQNPWVAAVQLADVASYYEAPVLAVLRWLLPAAALAWVVVSGVGRNLLLWRMEANRSPRPAFRPIAIIALQAAWLALFAVTLWGWLRCMQWAAATHITVSSEPDLVSYAIWAIFLSLSFFTAFALASWPLSIAPLLALLEGRSVVFRAESKPSIGQASSPASSPRSTWSSASLSWRYLWWPWCFLLRHCRSATSWAQAPCTSCGSLRPSSFSSRTTSFRWCGSKRLWSFGEYSGAARSKGPLEESLEWRAGKALGAYLYLKGRRRVELDSALSGSFSRSDPAVCATRRQRG